jgi:hypothetical protein
MNATPASLSVSLLGLARRATRYRERSMWTVLLPSSSLPLQRWLCYGHRHGHRTKHLDAVRVEGDRRAGAGHCCRGCVKTRGAEEVAGWLQEQVHTGFTQLMLGVRTLDLVHVRRVAEQVVPALRP